MSDDEFDELCDTPIDPVATNPKLVGLKLDNQYHLGIIMASISKPTVHVTNPNGSGYRFNRRKRLWAEEDLNGLAAHCGQQLNQWLINFSRTCPPGSIRYGELVVAQKMCSSVHQVETIFRGCKSKLLDLTFENRLEKAFPYLVPVKEGYVVDVRTLTKEVRQ